MNHYLPNQHISQENLDSFFQDKLLPNESLTLLEHIAQCTDCADLFAQSLEKDNLISAPKNIKDTIILKIHSKPKFQLFFYNMRVSIAMAGALLMLFSSSFSPYIISNENRIYNIPKIIRNFSNSVNESLTNIATIHSNNQ